MILRGPLRPSSSLHFLAPGGPPVYVGCMKIVAALVCAFLVSGFALEARATGSLQHVVCFKFKSTASEQDIKKVEAAFRELKQKIPQIVSIEWGTNVSKENRDKGFTHCFLLAFRSEQDRDTYITHPDHKAFGKIVGPVLDDVFVIDFWAKD